MLQTIFGLPVHPLIVHATVVVVPTAAVAVLLAAVWPRFRSWAGVLVPVLALVAVVLTPLSTSSGEALEGMVGRTPLVAQHQELAGMLIWWVVPLAVGAVGVWWATRRARGRRGLLIAAAVVSVIAGIGTTVQVVLIGHSGAEAAWHGVAAQSATSSSDEGN